MKCVLRSGWDSATCLFSPPGRSPRQRDEGARVLSIAGVAPSSDPSGHLLPGGEKKCVAPARS